MQRAKEPSSTLLSCLYILLLHWRYTVAASSNMTIRIRISYLLQAGVRATVMEVVTTAHQNLHGMS